MHGPRNHANSTRIRLPKCFWASPRAVAPGAETGDNVAGSGNTVLNVLSSNKHKKLRVALATVAALFVLYSLLGFLAAPYAIQRAMVNYAAEQFERKLSIGEVRLNPLLLRLEMKDVALAEQDSAPIAGFGMFVADFEMSSIVRWAWTFSEIRLDAPMLAVDIGPDGRLNLAALLDKLPKRVQPHAKNLLHEMYLASTKVDALKTYDRFVEEYGAKFPKAVECLRKDKSVLFTFYDFPAEHWVHIRSTNPIESTFATVRHRTRQTKGCGSRIATLTMVFKLATQAEKHWRRLNGYKLIPQVLQGVKFVDGVLKNAA